MIVNVDYALHMALVRCEQENVQLRKIVDDLQAKVKELQGNGEGGESRGD